MAKTGLFVRNVIFIVIIISFALFYFFLSIYPFITLWFQGEINALPLNYSLGVKFRHLVAITKAFAELYYGKVNILDIPTNVEEKFLVFDKLKAVN